MIEQLRTADRWMKNVASVVVVLLFAYESWRVITGRSTLQWIDGLLLLMFISVVKNTFWPRKEAVA